MGCANSKAATEAQPALQVPTSDVAPIAFGKVKNEAGYRESIVKDVPNGKVVTRVPNGEVVEILQRNTDDVQVRWNGMVGWIKTIHLKIEAAEAAHVTKAGFPML